VGRGGVGKSCGGSVVAKQSQIGIYLISIPKSTIDPEKFEEFPGLGPRNPSGIPEGIRQSAIPTVLCPLVAQRRPRRSSLTKPGLLSLLVWCQRSEAISTSHSKLNTQNSKLFPCPLPTIRYPLYATRWLSKVHHSELRLIFLHRVIVCLCRIDLIIEIS